LIPHFAVGVPLASQSLYRPYFGLALNLSSPLQRKGFPLAISAYVGMVDMKQNICTSACIQAFANYYGGPLPGAPTVPITPPAGAAVPTIGQDRALKPAFGIEVSIMGIASKLKGAGSGSATKSGH
jgi:hypothetical protein